MSSLNLGHNRGLKGSREEGLNFFTGIIADIDDMKAKGQFGTSGKNFLIHMTSTYVFLGGFQMYMWYVGMAPLMTAAGVSSEEGGVIRSMVLLPYSMTALFAIMSDSLPIFGYKKLPYMVLSVLCGSAAHFYLGFTDTASLGDDPVQSFLYPLVAVAIMGSLCDVLTQGQYAQIVKEKGPGLISFQYGASSITGLAASFVTGWILDINPQWAFIVAFPLALQAAPLMMCNFMGDRGGYKCLGGGEIRDIKIIVLGLAMGGNALLLVFSTGWEWFQLSASQTKLVLSLLTAAGLHGLSVWALPFNVAKMNMYLFLCRIFTTGLYYPVLQFYTTEPLSPSCIEVDPPNFPYLLFTTLASFFSAAAGLFAVFLFQKYVCHWNARNAFWVTTGFQCVAGLFDVMLISRLNRVLLGWTGLSFTFTFNERVVRADDVVSYLFGNNMLEPILLTLDGLPGTLLLSKIAPKGVETTVLACLTGFATIGRSMSGVLGSALLTHFGFSWSGSGEEMVCDMGYGYTVGEGGFQMNGLAWTLLVGDVLLPLATIPLTFLLIPNISLDDDFLDPEDYDRPHLQAPEARELSNVDSQGGFAPNAYPDEEKSSFILALDIRSASYVM